MQTSIRIAGNKVTSMDVTHYADINAELGGLYVIDLNIEGNGFSLTLNRAQADRICVALGQCLTDADPQAPAIMERDQTAPLVSPGELHSGDHEESGWPLSPPNPVGQASPGHTCVICGSTVRLERTVYGNWRVAKIEGYPDSRLNEFPLWSTAKQAVAYITDIIEEPTVTDMRKVRANPTGDTTALGQ